jgi:hypothetical protein
MRVALGGQVQLRIPGKQARHPTLAITGARHPNGTKYTLIAAFHVIAFMRTYHAVRTAHRFSNPPPVLGIQMILQ